MRRGSRSRAAGLGLAVALLVGAGSAGCGTHETAVPGVAGPALSPRASLTASATALRIGDTAELSLVVAAPPGTRVHPYEPPDVPGLALLGTERAAPEAGARQWRHRTRLRVRAEATGELRWPGSQVALEAAAGRRTTLSLPELTFVVASARDTLPGREGPFGLQPLEPAPAPRPAAALALAFAAGAAVTLLGVGAWRRRPRPARAAAPEPPGRAWQWAAERLSAAERDAARHPRDAARDASRTLRRYVSIRFGLPAEAASQAEIGRMTPPWAIERAWPELVEALARLEAVRFAPQAGPEADGARSAIAAARRWLEARERGVRHR